MRPSSGLPRFSRAPTGPLQPLLAAALLIATFCGSQPGHSAVPPAAVTCVGAGVADLEPVSASVDRLLRATWHREGENWFTALTIPPPPRNPFDLEASKLPPPTTTHGYLWAYGMRCDVTETTEGRPTSVVISATALAFYEDKTWSRPQQKGLIHLLRAEQRADGYTVVLVPTERSNLLPEATLRRPTATEIPVASRSLGLPCRGTARWDGRRCRAASAARPGRL